MTDEHHDGPPTAEPERAPAGVRTMALVRWALVIGMAVIAALSIAYSFELLPVAGAPTQGTQYYCPMHPQVVQDHPGECPICSMTLVPKQSGAAKKPEPQTGHAEKPSHAGHRHEPTDPYFCPMHPEETALEATARCPLCGMKLDARKPGTAAPGADAGAGAAAPEGVPGLVPVELSMDRVQLIGMKTAVARRAELLAELRAVGVVSADEAKIARVHTRFSGWIERLDVATTGQKVKKGQTLATIFNTELLPAQHEFLSAKRWSAERAAHPPSAPAMPHLNASLEQDARTRLELLGMSAAEIDRLAQTGVPSRTIAVTAPASGYVIAKNVVQGTYVQPGTELFEIADLSRVWVLADIYEYEMERVRVGQTAHVAINAYPGQRVTGKVGFLYPTLDTQTRTLRVRVELENTGMKLRPGMYGEIMLELGEAHGVVVPSEAVVDTGEYQYAFIAKEGGRFEPRRVRVGARTAERTQVLQGLVEGDVVVTTANFLVDSESRLRAAIDGSGSGQHPH